MRVFRFTIVPALAVAWMLYAGGPAMAGRHHGSHNGVMTAGKTGAVYLDTAVKIGEVSLAPGHYNIQHRVDGERHFVRFKSVEHRKEFKDVQCKLEQLNKKARFTSVVSVADGGGRRIAEVYVRGESVAHVFKN